jgi:predicted CXXCH cytochrome family protein
MLAGIQAEGDGGARAVRIAEKGKQMRRHLRSSGAVLAVAALACAARGRAPAPAPPAPYDPATAATAAGVTNPHAHDGKPFCGRCHARPGETKAVVDPIALCAQCHDAARMHHPFRVPPKKPPEGLPLMEGGLVACHTCHDSHDVAAHESGLRLPFSQLCLRCHERHGADK